MRMLGRLILFVVGLAALLALVYAARVGMTLWQTQQVQSWEDTYDQSIVYVLDPGETFEFDVPNEAIQLRILHTPVGVSRNDEVVTLSFVARPKQSLSETYRVTLNGEKAIPTERLPDRFFDSPQDNLAGTTKMHVVSFAQRQDLNQFSLTLAQSSRPLAIRVAFLAHHDEASSQLTWQRLNEENKTRLFEDHIFPVELVPQRERLTRLMERWQPIGPTASSYGRVNTRSLFVSERADAFDNEQEIVDELAVIGPQRWFTVDTRSQRNMKAFTCSNLSQGTALELELSSVNSIGKLETKKFKVKSENSRFPFPVKPALYQLTANQHCELIFFDENDNIISADYNYLRASIVQPNSHLAFALVPSARQKQPLRLDVRRLTRNVEAQPDSLEIQWRIVDSAGEQLLSGQLKPPTQPNPYQVSVDSSLTSTVHEKASHYIVAPANAAELQVQLHKPPASLSGQVLVNLYTRPAGLAFVVNAKDTNKPSKQNSPKWFLSYPLLNDKRLAAATRLISWQVPLEDLSNATETDVNAHWYTLKSINEAPYFELFLAEENQQQEDGLNAGSAHLIYAPINIDGSGYRVSAPSHAEKVRPQLVYQKDTDVPVPVEIQLNGKAVLKQWLNARSGRLFLPTLAQADYDLTITSPEAIQWYSNYQQVSGKQHYRVRYAYKLEQTLNFVVNKTAEEEWVTFNYFPAVTAPHQVTLTLEKQDTVGVYADYTVAKRSFPLTAVTTAPSVRLLNQNQAPLWQPVRLPFLLGSDLKEGRYRITVTSTTPQSGYVQAGYSAAAPLYQIEIYSEDDHALF